MMAQVPILVPIQAKSLSFSFAFYREPISPEVPLSVAVTNLHVYLACAPVTRLLDPVSLTPTEENRLFDKSYISGSYSECPTIATPLSARDNGTSYTKIRYCIQTPTTTGLWTTFATPNNIIDRNDESRAVLIFALDFQTMAVGEKIRTGEISWWFNYEI